MYLVWVDRYTEEAGVRVDQLVDVSDPQVPQHRRVVQVGQVGHVLAAVELGRVDLPNQVLLEDLLVAALDLDGDLLPLGVLNEPLGVPARGLVRHPARLFWVIRLGLDKESITISSTLKGSRKPKLNGSAL